MPSLSIRIKILYLCHSNIEVLVFANRLVAKTNQLETEKAQKEAEVNKVMEENVRLRAMLDKKEAQLQAMSEQCKFMAMSRHD
jgi:ABC-type molybdate transport system ATPase subunit